MLKQTKRTLLSLAVAVLVVGLGFTDVDGKEAPEKVVIKLCQKKKTPVTFPHGKHVKKLKIKCDKCHHKGKAGTACGTAKCHAGKAKGKVPGCQELSVKKNPFHIRCRGCHKTDPRAKNKAPTTCKKCHK